MGDSAGERPCSYPSMNRCSSGVHQVPYGTHMSDLEWGNIPQQGTMPSTDWKDPCLPVRKYPRPKATPVTMWGLKMAFMRLVSSRLKVGVPMSHLQLALDLG